MDFLRKFLVVLRREFYGDRRRFYTLAGAAAVALALLTLLIDWLAPFHTWGVLLRSAALVPTALAFFALGYGTSLAMHDTQVRSNDDWIPYRARFSPRWRIQISLVIGALLFVFAYATTRGIGYTLSSSIIGAVVVALLAFVRSTREEARRTQLGVPDARDVAYTARRRVHEREVTARKEKANRRKRNRR